MVTTSLAVRHAGRKPVTVFPNPFHSELTIQSDQPFHGATVTLTNLFGQPVSQTAGVSGQRFILKRGNWPGGIYFLHITEDNELRTMQRIAITD